MHSICGDNTQSGNCGLECSDYLESKCTISDEIVLTLKGEELEDHYELYPDDRPKRTIVLNGETVELHDWSNYVACDGDGTWQEFSREPYVAFAPCTWASLGSYGHLMDGPANENWRESLINLNKPESTKRTIVLDGKTVELDDKINFVTKDSDGLWYGYKTKPTAGNRQWFFPDEADDDYWFRLHSSEPSGLWKDSLIDLNNLTESSPKALTLEVGDSAITTLHDRMIANDIKHVKFTPKTPPAEIYNHTCSKCSKPCHRTNSAVVCPECAP